MAASTRECFFCVGRLKYNLYLSVFVICEPYLFTFHITIFLLTRLSFLSSPFFSPSQLPIFSQILHLRPACNLYFHNFDPQIIGGSFDLTVNILVAFHHIRQAAFHLDHQEQKAFSSFQTQLHHQSLVS